MSLKAIVARLGGELYDGGRRANIPGPGPRLDVETSDFRTGRFGRTAGARALEGERSVLGPAPSFRSSCSLSLNPLPQTRRIRQKPAAR